MPTLAERIQKAVSRVKDQAGLLELLRDALEWPIPEDAASFEDLGYDWTEPESQVEVRQLLPGQPWGIFLVVGSKPTFRTELRKILRRLVSNRRDAALPQWKHENLLFLCITKDHKSITFAHFKGETAASARLALFGWLQHDLHIHTLCKHNLPALVWPADTTRWSAAFDVEAVTKSFFKEYREVFDLVEGKVKGVPKGEARRLYTQRLFNRLLFLYFIQRKNWLDFNGDKRYLRALFTAAVAAKEDFLNDRLYWAFFYGLNNGMEDRASHSIEELIERRGTVPFLNGGLFDLESDFDVQHAVTIDNAAFGKVLDLFEKYNFTVAESTPLDVEVAVDPEMLGKVFEELVTGRHESGSYYTPRPIVSFMCREALKYYLQGALRPAGNPSSPLPQLCGGEVGVEVAKATSTPGEGEPRAEVKSPQSRVTGETPDALEPAIAKFVDDGDPSALTAPETVLAALKRVKVCDPACGSGAYLLGMMQELLRLREALFARHSRDHKNIYDRKLEIIQNNLYGVDLDEFATNIAKLRLWLSLAVDYIGTKPEPLPNLDFKIEQGDSLTAPDPQDMSNMFRQAVIAQSDELTDLKGSFIRAHGAEKKRLLKEIKEREAKLGDQLPVHSPIGSVDWRIAFAEVFRNGGFDIALANPPYLRQEVVKQQFGDQYKPRLTRLYPQAYVSTADLYVAFYARANQLVNTGGVGCFISSNKWLKAGYGEKLRHHLLDQHAFHLVLDFGELPVFDAAATFPAVFIWQNQPRVESPTNWAVVKDLAICFTEGIREHVAKIAQPIPASQFGSGKARLASSNVFELRSKMEKAGKPLGQVVNGRIFNGIKTGLNEAFVIDDETRRKIIAKDPKSAEVIKPFFLGDDVRRNELHRV